MSFEIEVLLVSFAISIILGIITIPILRKLKVGQIERDDGPASHLKKQGTPTMGGIIIIITMIIGTIATAVYLYATGESELATKLVPILLLTIGFGAIGFIDDYLIIIKHNNKGLSEKAKFLLQIIIAVIFFYLFMISGNEPLLWIHSLNIKLDIGWYYGLFILLVLVASSNAVNLTDGLDGLAGGLSAIAICTFGILSFNTGWLEGYEEIAIFCFTLTGSILGFLVFNVSPAKVFMGDTGSLCLGATLGTIAILTRHEILLIVIGIVFVIETITCLIQRYYYKLTKKRFFPMTPIHHTFEKLGWREQDIVKLFWIIGFIGSMIGIIYGVWM